MAFSNEERRLLRRIEAALVTEDPKLEDALGRSRLRRLHRRRAAIGGAGFFVGLVILLVGIFTTRFVTVTGYVLMLTAAVTVINSWWPVSPSGDHRWQEAEVGEGASPVPQTRERGDIGRPSHG